jgi:hypothetical protein
VLELPAGWSSLVLTVSVAVLFPLVMAPLVLVTAAGGDLAPLLSVWPPALGGALIGALCAVIATLGIRGITRSQSWLGRILQAAPAPVLAVGTVVAFGAMAGAFELGPLLLISVIGTVIGLQSAARHAPSVPPLSLAARDAARDLGANPATASVPIPARSVSVGVLTVAAETVGAGAFAFVVIAGLSHPLVIALSTELMSQRPTAAAAALSILAVVAVLRGIAAWTARQSNLGEEL